MKKEKLKEFQLNPHYEVELKPNTKIAVGWYMNKYQAFDKRVGIFGKQHEAFHRRTSRKLLAAAGRSSPGDDRSYTYSFSAWSPRLCHRENRTNLAEPTHRPHYEPSNIVGL